MAKRVRQGCAGATMHPHQPSEVVAELTESSKPFAAKVEKLKSGDVMVAFGPSAQKHFRRLFDLLENRDDFDGEGETLAHIEDLSHPGQHSLPIAFAMIAEVVRDVTAYAQSNTAYTPRLMAILDDLTTDLSGFGAEREPIQTNQISRNR